MVFFFQKSMRIIIVVISLENWAHGKTLWLCTHISAEYLLCFWYVGAICAPFCCMITVILICFLFLFLRCTLWCKCDVFFSVETNCYFIIHLIRLSDGLFFTAFAGFIPSHSSRRLCNIGDSDKSAIKNLRIHFFAERLFLVHFCLFSSSSFRIRNVWWYFTG